MNVFVVWYCVYLISNELSFHYLPLILWFIIYVIYETIKEKK